MSDSGPYFCAWCDEKERIDAYAAMLHALATPGDVVSVIMDPDIWEKTSVDNAVALVRANFRGKNVAYVSFGVMLAAAEHDIWFASHCFTDESERRRPSGPMSLWVCDKSDFLLSQGNLALGDGPRSIEAEAMVHWHLIYEDLEDLLIRFCAPDASGRVPTGACTNGWGWQAPIQMCATYNADAKDIARDLALSWVSLHDKASAARVAGTPLEVLHAQVEAAPHGSRVEVKGAGQFSLSR
jgi:hypothetical protein